MLLTVWRQLTAVGTNSRWAAASRAFCPSSHDELGQTANSDKRPLGRGRGSKANWRSLTIDAESDRSSRAATVYTT